MTSARTNWSRSSVGNRIGRPPFLRPAALAARQIAEDETELYLLFEAVAGMMSEASKQQPIILILDDLVWVISRTLEGTQCSTW